MKFSFAAPIPKIPYPSLPFPESPLKQSTSEGSYLLCFSPACHRHGGGGLNFNLFPRAFLVKIS
jgi:hypothetical protein